MATDPTTEAGSQEQSPAAPAAAGDVSVLAELFAGPDTEPDTDSDRTPTRMPALSPPRG